MRRRFKLFATIASLCLAIGLMAFGVYAATTVTYTVNGSVTYTMTDVLVDIQSNLQYVTDRKQGNSDLSGDVTQLSALTYANDKQGTKWYSYDQATNIANTNTSGSETIECNFNTSSAYKLTFTINTIQSSVGVDVAASLTGIAEGANYQVTPAADYSNVTIATNGSTTLTYYIYLLDPTQSIVNGTFNIALTMTQSA